jgi:hypothetical protein
VALRKRVMQAGEQAAGEALGQPRQQQDDDDARDADQRRARLVVQVSED